MTSSLKSTSLQVYKLSTDVAEDTALFANQQINRKWHATGPQLHIDTTGTAADCLAYAGSLNGETRTLLLQVLVKNGQFDTNNILH